MWCQAQDSELLSHYNLVWNILEYPTPNYLKIFKSTLNQHIYLSSNDSVTRVWAVNGTWVLRFFSSIPRKLGKCGYGTKCIVLIIFGLEVWLYWSQVFGDGQGWSLDIGGRATAAYAGAARTEELRKSLSILQVRERYRQWINT